MRQFIIAAAILSAASMSAFAQQGQNGTNQNGTQNGQNVVGAPAPLLAAGPVGLAICVGFGIYWLRNRRR